MIMQISGQAAEVILTPQQLADRWHTTTGSLAQQRYRGVGPTFTRIGSRTIRYAMSDVLAYEEAQRYSRTDTKVSA